MKLYLVVHGFVQGVGYRYVVKRTAKKYNLRGMVKNLPDGSVCILVDGEKDEIEKFEKEINVDFQHGPQVHNVERFPEGSRGFPGSLKNYEKFVVER